MFKQSWEEWYALFLFHCDMYEGVQPEIAFHRFEKFYENENLLIAMYHIKCISKVTIDYGSYMCYL